jgi:hypothetical protein
MASRILSRDEVEELDLPHSCIWKEHVYDSRWANHFDGVFIHPEDGKAYMISWQRGKSEIQDDMDTWYDNVGIEAYEAKQIQVTKTEWSVA